MSDGYRVHLKSKAETIEIVVKAASSDAALAKAQADNPEYTASLPRGAHWSGHLGTGEVYPMHPENPLRRHY